MTRAGLQEGGTESGKTPEPGKQSWPGDWASVGGSHNQRGRQGSRAITQVEPTGGGDCRARGRCNQGRLWVAKRVTQQGDDTTQRIKG